jgi:hypothetical protein
MKTRLSIIIKALFALSAFLVVWAGCADNPVTPAEEHFEARGVALRINGVDTVVVDSNRLKQGRIVVKEGTETEHIALQFIEESDGTRGLPPSDEEDFKLGWTIADTTIASLEQDSDHDGKWSFHIKGLKAGSTTIVIKLLHGDHPDFQSVPIPVEVTP